MSRKSGKKTAREDSKKKQSSPTDDILAAFDRERDEAHELNRRHREQVRASRANDSPARNENWPRQK